MKSNKTNSKKKHTENVDDVEKENEEVAEGGGLKKKVFFEKKKKMPLQHTNIKNNKKQ